MKILPHLTLAACLAGVIALSEPVSAQTTLFSDPFNTDTSANWSVFNGSGTGTPDFTAEFNFNYSTNKFVRNGVTNTIPPAPNGGGNGVKLTANKNDAVAEISAVSIYPTGQVFSNNYSLKFDMWINYNGGFQGGSGSTEFAQFGINTVGDKVNAVSPVPGNSDGVWFALTGEAGAARDYRAYLGDTVNPSPAAELQGATGGFLDRNFDGIIDAANDQEVFGEANTNLFKLMFPKPTYETDGMPSKQWSQVEVRQRTNSGVYVVTWLINGYVIAEHSSGEQFGQVMGNIMLGTTDPFSSIANPKADNFIIYDNVRVQDLTGVNPLPVVSVIAATPEAGEPNTNGVFTISRTGDTTSPLTVNYQMANVSSASNGVDYAVLNGVAVIPAGASSTNVNLVVINDAIGEPTESAIMVLIGSTNYDIYNNLSATVTVADDGDLPIASVFSSKTNAYELNPNNSGKLNVRLSNPSSFSVTIPLTISGTAVSGTDYTALPSSVTIPAGQTNSLLEIRPINNNNVDTNRTVTVTIGSGAGYALGTPTNGTVTIRNDDLPPAVGVLFSENFDVDPTANWTINNGPSDGSADFFFNYSTVSIPPAPNTTNGTTRGLKLQANMANAIFSGISVSPTGKAFTNDYRLRFDMWINFHGATSGANPLGAGGAGSTQLTGGGVGTAGTSPQWPGFADSIYFMTSGDGNTGTDYRAYAKGVVAGYADASGVFAAGTTGTPRDNLNAYYAEFGRESAPTNQAIAFPNQTGTTLAGAQGFIWRDVQVIKQGTNVIWKLDNKTIATVPLTNTIAGANILFNQSDINAGTSAADPNAITLQFGLIDNVRVEDLTVVAVVAPTITSTQVINGGTQVQIDFTGGANTFTLLSSAVVTGPYGSTAATLSNTGAGTFRFVTAVNGAQRFFRIQAN